MKKYFFTILKSKVFFCFLVFNFIQLTIFSQKNSVKFQVIPLEQGLSNKAISAIVEDPEGFLWFATQDGLNKYNGYEFKVFQNDPSDVNTISNNNIFSLIQDKDGYLWLGTENGGLNRFDPNTHNVVRFLHDDNDPKSISSNNVYSIHESKKGELWIGTLESGFDVLDKKTGKVIQRYKNNANNINTVSKGAIWDIYEDPQGNMWLATWGGGLDKLDTKTGTFKHFKHNAKDPSTISCDIVGSIFEDNGFFWITTWGGGLNKFDPLKETFKSFLSNASDPKSIGSNLAWPIAKDEQGNVWVGTYGTGLNRFDLKTETFERFSHDANDINSLNFNDVWSLHFDRSGILWVGTEGAGISKFVDLKKQVNFFNSNPGNSLSIGHNSVRGIAADPDGTIWIGTWDGGVDRFDPLQKKITNFKKDAKDGNNTGFNKIRVVYCGLNEKMWLGSYRGGLVEFEKKTGAFTSYTHDPRNDKTLSDNYVYSIAEDKKGNFWVGTLNGLNIFDRSTKEFVRFKHDPKNDKSISNNTVNKLYVTRSGELWIATDLGLNTYNYETRSFSRFYHNANDSTSLTHNTVYTLLEDKTGTLWVGTRNGLDRFIPATKTFEHFTTKDGLPDNMIMAIEEDNRSQLLISTKKGISRFNKNSKTFINYDVRDGIRGRLFFPNASCISKTGKVYFGSTEGLDSFYPDSLENNKYVPPVIITSIKKHEEIINFKGPIFSIKELVLSYSENNLSFEFVALSYASPEDNQYSFKLEGVDRNWQYNGNRRTAHYANLSPGTYSFKVRASNNDGLWNEKGATVKIIIRPPFWKTTWFRILCIVAGILIVLAYIKHREKKLNREKKVLENKVEERTQEVVHQKEQLEDKNKEITDSILYAKKIQEAILPSKAAIRGALPDSFILFRPRDIVSGDFFWFSEKKGKIIIAAADCTGHGVPGAFMSMIGNTLLNEIVNEKEVTVAGKILDLLRENIMKSLHQTGASGENKDGMDIALCTYNRSNGELEFAGANNPLYIVSNGELIELKGDKQPIGVYGGEPKPFTTHKINYKPGDCFYIASDGYADQFGGAGGKKFKYKQLKDLIISITGKPMEEQKNILETTIYNWKGQLEQVDDILLIGFKLPGLV